MMKWFVQDILLSDRRLVRSGKGVMVRRKTEKKIKIESRGRNIRKKRSCRLDTYSVFQKAIAIALFFVGCYRKLLNLCNLENTGFGNLCKS